MVYIVPGNRARGLVQASSITPPLRGSRRGKGGARRRAGGGPTRRSVSESERWVGGAGRRPGGLARTRPGMMEEVPVKAGSVRVVRAWGGPQAVCRNKDAGGTPALPGGVYDFFQGAQNRNTASTGRWSLAAMLLGSLGSRAAAPRATISMDSRRSAMSGVQKM